MSALRLACSFSHTHCLSPPNPDRQHQIWLYDFTLKYKEIVIIRGMHYTARPNHNTDNMEFVNSSIFDISNYGKFCVTSINFTNSTNSAVWKRYHICLEPWGHSSNGKQMIISGFSHENSVAILVFTKLLQQFAPSVFFERKK